MSIEEQTGQLPEHQPKSGNSNIEVAMPGEDMFRVVEKVMNHEQGLIETENMGLNADPNYKPPTINDDARILAG